MQKNSNVRKIFASYDSYVDRHCRADSHVVAWSTGGLFSGPALALAVSRWYFACVDAVVVEEITSSSVHSSRRCRIWAVVVEAVVAAVAVVSATTPRVAKGVA